MDSIIIENLEIYAYHGVNPEEKEYGQRFLICATLSCDLSHAAQTDDVADTVNYAAAVKLIRKVFTSAKYNLIETCAGKICDALLAEFSTVSAVSITVKKPDAPMKAKLDYAAVNLHRSRT